MEIDAGACLVRSWKRDDAASLVRHADNRKIWRNLRDSFPHPYTEAEAAHWVGAASSQERETNFAIEVDGEAAGGIGFVLQTDVSRRSAEIGYWLGEAYWGRGVCTAALISMTEHAFSNFDLVRLYAGVFDWNPASRRVLEKAGYEFEGTQKKAVFKDGEIIDQHLYACVR